MKTIKAIDPIVDVVMPVYNGAATIRDAVESILKQTLQDIRIIVIDDGSRDATPEILAEMVRLDSRVEVHRQTNSGIVDALNHGLSLCRADYVARHDADDLSYPERLETQFSFLRSNPGCVAVGCAARHIDKAGRSLNRVVRLRSPDDCDLASLPSREPYILHPFLMVRAKAVKAVGGYRYAYNAEDTDLYWRLQEQGGLVNLDVVLGDYRVHDESISGRSVANGRVMALNSQLSALSAARRRRGDTDLSFPKGLPPTSLATSSLEDLVAQAGKDLRDDERAYLELAVPAKLMELASYRPFELDLEDCKVVSAHARRALHDYAVDDVSRYQRLRSGAATRLLLHGHWSRAIAILTLLLVPGVVARVLLRKLVSPRTRDRLRQTLGREAYLTKP